MALSLPHPAFAWTHHLVIDIPPEIYPWVGNYLATADVAACARVSKEWHSMYSPLLYMALDLREPQQESNDPFDKLLSPAFVARIGGHARQTSVGLPSTGVLNRYVHYVEHLALDKSFAFKRNTLVKMSSLQDLRIQGGRSCIFSTSLSRVIFKTMFANNPGIEILDLRSLDLSKALSWICEACPNMSALRLSDSTFHLVDLTKGSGARQSLMNLFIYKCSIRNRDDSPFPQALLNIREIEFLDCFGPGWASIYELVSRCSRSRSIVFKFNGRSMHSSFRLRFTNCQELAKVTIMKAKTDQELAEILDSCPKALSELAIVNCFVGERVIKASQRHFGTLVTFRLVGVGSCMMKNRDIWMENRARMVNERKMTEAILRSCPNLSYLECPQLEGTVVFPGKTGQIIWSYYTIQGHLFGDLLALSLSKSE